MAEATTDKSTLEQKVLPELQEIASSLGVEGHQRMKKGELIDAIIERGNGESGTAQAAEAPRTESRPQRSETSRREAPSRERGPRGDGRPDRRGRRGRGRDRERRGIPEATEEEIAEAPVMTGILDVLPEGYGFLRTTGYLPSQQDIYASLSQIRRFGLRKGDEVKGAVRRPKDSEKYLALLRIET
ncbi:MAG: Rho termination factor N-terminal domain-containing protein, partial [Actinomycetota bacterium]